MADSDFNFVDHMDRAQKAQAEAQADAEMYERHKIWLETTWGGFAVTTIRTIADNRFFRAIGDALYADDQDERKSASAILLTNAARLAVVLSLILFVVVLGKVLEMVVGTEILVEQEIIIEEEVRRSDVEGGINGDSATCSGEGTRRENATDKEVGAGGSASYSKKDN